MLENIKLIGIDDDFIDEMIDTIGYDMVLDLASNYELVEANAKYLKSLSLNIKMLLLNRPEIFLKETEKLQLKFNKSNINQIIELINEDYTIIDEL